MLIDIAGEAGLDREQFATTIDERFSELAQVVVDEHVEAVEAGITGVPAQVVNGGYLIQGAQAQAFYARVVTRFQDDDPTDARAAIDWPVNHVRSVEANFDVHHFPFVHGSVVPGLGHRVDPYEVRVEGTSIRTHGSLRREGKQKGFDFRVDFEAPTLVLLEFSGIVFVVADCPIDEYNTRRIVAYRQTWVRLPWIGRALSWIMMMADWKLLQNRQDMRVAAAQRPRLPDTGVEHLVHADAGTAAYRKLRHRLLREAEVEVAHPGDSTAVRGARSA